jgi:hypothetical protein
LEEELKLVIGGEVNLIVIGEIGELADIDEFLIDIFESGMKVFKC